MKKVLVSVLLTVCIMGAGCAGVVCHYETELENANFRYNDSVRYSKEL